MSPERNDICPVVINVHLKPGERKSIFSSKWKEEFLLTVPVFLAPLLPIKRQCHLGHENSFWTGRPLCAHAAEGDALRQPSCPLAPEIGQQRLASQLGPFSAGSGDWTREKAGAKATEWPTGLSTCCLDGRYKICCSNKLCFEQETGIRKLVSKRPPFGG